MIDEQQRQLYYDGLRANAKFNSKCKTSSINWIRETLDMEFTYSQFLIGPLYEKCPINRGWCCSVNLLNTYDDGLIGFVPADINEALCPNLDPEHILINDPKNFISALIYCRALPDSEIMSPGEIEEHIKHRMGLNEGSETHILKEKLLNKIIEDDD